MRSALGRPRGQRQDVGGIRTRSQLCFRTGDRQLLPEEERTGSGLQGPSGRRRRLRILRKKAAGHCILSPQLLRVVQQQRSHDADRVRPHLLLPGPPPLVENGRLPQQPPQDPNKAWGRMILYYSIYYTDVIAKGLSSLLQPALPQRQGALPHHQ